MKFYFHGYTVRLTSEADLPLAIAWSARALDAGFWLKQEPGCESFLVSERVDEKSLASHPAMSKVVYENEYPIAFFQTQHVVGARSQVRLTLQASPAASPKKLLRAITKLVPLIEQALSLRGVKAIFFTSHSAAMASYMAKHHGYRYAGEGGADGVVMAKRIGHGSQVLGVRPTTYDQAPATACFSGVEK